MSHIQSQSQYNEGHSLEAIKKICGVPARLTGFFSLVIQTIVLIVAIGLSVLAFYQLGGFKMLGAKVLNETEQNDNTLFPTPAMLEIKHILSNDTDSFSLTDQDYGWNETFDADNMTSTNKSKHGSSLLQQIGPIYLRVGKAELDVISLLRLSTLIYIGLGVFWLISLACLAMSLRYEVLDLVYINTFILTIVLIYTLVQGLLVGIIIFYQKKFNWIVLLIVCGAVSIYLICFIFEIISTVFLIVWYRYIDYINGSNETCMCTSSIAQLIKNRRRGPRERQTAAADYSIPEATRHANLPYIDEPVVQQFSSF